MKMDGIGRMLCIDMEVHTWMISLRDLALFGSLDYELSLHLEPSSEYVGCLLLRKLELILNALYHVGVRCTPVFQ